MPDYGGVEVVNGVIIKIELNISYLQWEGERVPDYGGVEVVNVVTTKIELNL